MAARQTSSTARRPRLRDAWPRPRHAEVSGITGTLVLSRPRSLPPACPISQARPAHMSIANGVLYFDDVAFSACDTGDVRRQRRVRRDPITLDMTITGVPGLRPFSVLSPQLSVDGIATLNVHLTGAVAEPRGSPAGLTSNWRARAARSAGDCLGHLRARSVRRRPHLDPRLLRLGERRLPRCQRPESALDGLQVTGGEIAIQARGVAIEYPENVDTEIDALLTFVPAHGDIATPTAARRRPGAARRLSRHGEPAAPWSPSTAAPAPPADTSHYIDAMRLDIASRPRTTWSSTTTTAASRPAPSLRLAGTVAGRA